MFRINENHIAALAVASFILLLTIEAGKITVLSEVRVLAGIYLLLVPTGFLFISMLMPGKAIGEFERLLLSISLSIPINTSAILGLYLWFGTALTFFNNLAIVFSLCILFYIAYMVQARMHITARGLLGMEK